MQQTQNVRLPLPDGAGPPAVLAAAYRPELANSLGQLHAAAVKLSELDAHTSELVRLRCAIWHECRVCKSLRWVDHGERVLDESAASKVADYESSDLDVRHKVALRLTDAFMTVPGDITEELRHEVRQHFTDQEVVEMLLDIIAWTQQKPLVSFALDIPPEAALTGLVFDEAGHYSFGEALA